MFEYNLTKIDWVVQIFNYYMLLIIEYGGFHQQNSGYIYLNELCDFSLAYLVLKVNFLSFNAKE